MAVVKKLQMAQQEVVDSCGCKSGCGKCAPEVKFLAAMSDACIPVAYWSLKMSGFIGAENIKCATMDYIKDIRGKYLTGTNVCFAGSLGTGKTYSITNILKAAIAHGFSAYYTSLGEMVSGLTNPYNKFIVGDLLISSDFLAIDEVDSRYIATSEAAQELFGSNFERIVRFRIQNKLPILFATNNASIDEAFGGQFRKTIESLASVQTIVVPALGKDHRLLPSRRID